MGIFTGIIVYLMVYWLVIFWVLPWGNKPTETTDGGKTVASAPINPRIVKKFIITGIISALIWIVVYILIDMQVLDFYEMAREMKEEDFK